MEEKEGKERAFARYFTKSPFIKEIEYHRGLSSGTEHAFLNAGTCSEPISSSCREVCVTAGKKGSKKECFLYRVFTHQTHSIFVDTIKAMLGVPAPE